MQQVVHIFKIKNIINQFSKIIFCHYIALFISCLKKTHIVQQYLLYKTKQYCTKAI